MWEEYWSFICILGKFIKEVVLFIVFDIIGWNSNLIFNLYVLLLYIYEELVLVFGLCIVKDVERMKKLKMNLD